MSGADAEQFTAGATALTGRGLRSSVSQQSKCVPAIANMQALAKADARDDEMTLEIDGEVSDGILVYRMKGVTTSESMIHLADRIREDADANGIKAALLDCAGMTGSLQISALHRVGEYFGRNLAKVRLAAINAPPSWKANHFSEDVIGSRGGELRHFASRESARRWLLEA